MPVDPGVPIVHARTTAPPVKPPASKPVPLLQQNGFAGTIDDFNERVQAVHDAHTKAVGYPPSPALTLAVARNAEPHDYPGLFARTSHQHAETVNALANHPPVDANKELVGEMTSAIRADAFDSWANANNDRIEEAFADPTMRAELVQAAAKEGLTKPAQILAQSFLVNPHSALNRGINFTGNAASQITLGLALGLPTLAFAEGRGVKHSIEQRSLRPLGHENVKLAKGVVKGVKQDINDPGANAGNLILDVFGIVSLLGGGFTRAARANEAVLERGGALTGVKVAARRPPGGVADLTKHGYSEEQLLTENPVLRPLQKVLVSRRNAAMERRASPAPGGAIGINLGERVRNALDLTLDPIRGNFSSENKLGREGRVRRRIETQIQMTLKRDLDMVAGWSQTASSAVQRINQRMPNRFKSLTVGEQKAIQALSLDDPTPIATWRSFHQRMIDLDVGDVAAHRAQLAALKLAEKALEDPRPRFVEALELTREVIAEQERIKADELGLNVSTAERRVIGLGEFVRQAAGAKTPDELAAIPKPGELGGGPRQSETSFYLPVAQKGKPRKGVSEKLELMSPQKGKFGVPEPTLPSSLRHEITGKGVIMGNFRFDASVLAGNEFGQAVRAASKLSEWQKLRDSGVANPPDLRWFTPVRKGHAVDDRLRDIMDRSLDADLNTDDALHLSSLEAQDLQRYLYPAEFKNGHWHLLPDVAKDDVTWVDVRLLDRYRPPAPQGMKTFFQIANEPVRDLRILFRPAYALNGLGSAGMGIIHQGVLLPPNLMRAVSKSQLYGEKVGRAIEVLAGTTKTQSFAAQSVGAGIAKTLTSPGRIAARAWNVVTDQKFREAAVIHELRRQANELGLDPNERSTMESILFDEKYASNRNQAVRRGNKAMVEFDNQTWIEREYLRHFVFVYPWVTRSFVWSLRSIVEHPVQAAVLNQIGREADEEFPQIMKRVPKWFQQAGYVPVGYNDDGTPKLVNGSSVNTWSTLGQVYHTVRAGFSGDETAATSDIAGPGIQFLVHGFTGKDEFGNDYPGGDWWGAAKDVFLSLPQLRPSQRKKDEALPPVDLSDRETLIHRLNGALKQTVFTPGWLDGYGALITGGLTPKSLTSKDTLLARWYKDAPLAERHKLEMDLIHRAVKMQGELVGQPVPRPVLAAVDLTSQRELAYKVFAEENGRTPTDKERILSDIKVLQAKSRMSEEDAAILAKKAGKITDPQQLDRFRSGVLNKYADAKTLRDWDSDVRFVWSFRPEVLKDKLAVLHAQGLVSSGQVPRDQATLTAWGREALKYRRESRQRARQIEAAAGTTDAALLEADYHVWTDAQDKPVRVGATELPSPVQMEWANETPEERAAHIAGLTKASWSGLTNFDKQLLGHKVPASMSKAWAEVVNAKAQFIDQNPGSRIQPEQLLALAKQIDKDPRYTGFLKDYQFSLQPRIARFEASSVYRKMPADLRTEFDKAVGEDAKTAAKALRSGNYSNGEVRAAWQKYIEEDVVPKLKPDLKAFLAPYGVSFLTGLVSR